MSSPVHPPQSIHFQCTCAACICSSLSSPAGAHGGEGLCDRFSHWQACFQRHHHGDGHPAQRHHRVFRRLLAPADSRHLRHHSGGPGVGNRWGLLQIVCVCLYVENRRWGELVERACFGVDIKGAWKAANAVNLLINH